MLFAIGRVPNTDCLDLAKTGLAADQRGFLPVNEHLETSVPGIFATGDVNGRFMLQHAAAFEVHYLRQKFLKGHRRSHRRTLVAHAVFSHPEVASVGFTEEQLKQAARPTSPSSKTGSPVPGRGHAHRLPAHQAARFTGATTRSSAATSSARKPSTLLHQVMMLMRLKNDVRELANMIYIHPALNECLLAAAVKAVGMVKAARS